MSDDKSESKYRSVRIAEKWKAQKYEYQQEHKATLCKIYLVSLLVTIGLAFYTYTVVIDGKPCAGSWVRDSLWLVLVMHATNITQQVCALTGLENFFCSGICNLCLDIYEIGVLIFMMNQVVDSTHCKDDPETVNVYACLVVNTVIYWIFFAISWFIKIHSFCRSPNNKEIEEEVDAEGKAREANKMK